MDRISDSGSEDLGSNPDEVTNKPKVPKKKLKARFKVFFSGLLVFKVGFGMPAGNPDE